MPGTDMSEADFRAVKAKWKENADALNQSILESHDKVGWPWEKALHDEEARLSIFKGGEASVEEGDNALTGNQRLKRIKERLEECIVKEKRGMERTLGPTPTFVQNY
ncbi:hypothetical protein CEP53_009942 [Fusarium sp. AF-6]|nr:hypothetical protein CEP53_009942 [Fusarium sp. AF-6]